MSPWQLKPFWSSKRTRLSEKSWKQFYPGTIHLLLTDCMMADMGGPDLAKAMKERRPDLRVILIAACPDGGLLVLNYGWHLIKKLFFRAGLLERVRVVLGVNFATRKPNLSTNE